MARSTLGPKGPGLTTVQALAVASQFGVTLAVAVGLGLFVGQWLDRQLHTGIALTLIGVFLGLAAAATSTVALYQASLRKSERAWRARGAAPADDPAHRRHTDR